MINDKEFCGSEKLKQMFDDLNQTEYFPHAIIICGEDGQGRNLFARLIARDYLDDTNSLTLRHVHPDCIVIKGSGSSNTIPVDVIRSVSYEVNKASIMTDMRRVVIIEDGYNLNVSSSAALLKTLEQPPKGVVFLITVSSVDNLLDTIKSRCITVTIVPPTADECIDYIKKLRPEETATLIEKYSILFRGRIGYILRALDNDEFRQSLDIAEQFSDYYYMMDEFMMCSVLDRVENRNHMGEILELLVFCLVNRNHGDITDWAVKKVDEMKNMLSKNVSYKLFSTVLVKQLQERNV